MGGIGTLTRSHERPPIAGETVEFGQNQREVMDEQPVDILLVEDEEAHAELIRRAFESHFRRVRLTGVANLKEARDFLAKSLPDLVIADLNLPDGKGTELLSAKNEQAPFPLVVMTGQGDEHVAVEAIKAGALDYLVKSETTLADMPHITERTLREWGHITERRRAEETVRESEERYKRLSEITLEGIALHDKGRLIDINAAFAKMFGYGVEELIGKNVIDIVAHPDDRRVVHMRIATDYEKPYEIRAQRKDGTIFPLEIETREVRYKGDIYRIAAVRNVTERKRAEKEQLQRERLQGVLEMAGATCHELNQPIQVISGYSELLSMGMSEHDPLYKNIGKIKGEIMRISKIIRKLMGITRYETCSYPGGKKIIDIDKASKGAKETTYAWTTDVTEFSSFKE